MNNSTWASFSFSFIKTSKVFCILGFSVNGLNRILLFYWNLELGVWHKGQIRPAVFINKVFATQPCFCIFYTCFDNEVVRLSGLKSLKYLLSGLLWKRFANSCSRINSVVWTGSCFHSQIVCLKNVMWLHTCSR